MRGTVRHRFPVYEENDFKTWVSRIANPKFSTLDDQKIYSDFFVCDTHFTEDCRSPGTKRLNRGSLPTLCLLGEYFNGYM